MTKLETVTAKVRNAFAYNYTPLGTPTDSGGWTPAAWSDINRRGHRKKLSTSSFIPARQQRWTWYAVAGTTLLVLWILLSRRAGLVGEGYTDDDLLEDVVDDRPDSEQPTIEIGKKIEWNGREVFWWEQFRKFRNYYSGWQNIVPYDEYISEQEGPATAPSRGSPLMVQLDPYLENGRTACTLDNGVAMPSLSAYNGLPQGMPTPLFGSHEELGFRSDVCYDRVHRYGPYGLGYDESEGGLAIGTEGDLSGIDNLDRYDYRSVRWGDAQTRCQQENSSTKLPRTAVVIRVWHDLVYTPHRIMMLRAMIAELSLASGGQYEIHFLIDVHDETIPIWADEAVYNGTLKKALPEEFSGMGTLWSVSQMRFVYPGPFAEYINFSGTDLYLAYRSLHFSMQYFASRHPEYDYFWHWEVDLRVTGHYYELLDRITKWAEKQDRDHLWERSERFFIPSLYRGSYDEFTKDVVADAKAYNETPITGPQLPEFSRLPMSAQAAGNAEIVDLITLTPLFDPSRTSWAFRDDISGYQANETSRPPTRASLITATRLSRRLLDLMHEETFRKKHTMFPEMYPASIALHYGLKAVHVPVPLYFDREFPPEHANEVFNNAPLSDESKMRGMDHGHGRFHDEGGSVFGPAEHVFRGSTYYSNAAFAASLWRSWLGGEGMAEREVKPLESEADLGATGKGGTGGRMCLPMMLIHPVKYE